MTLRSLRKLSAAGLWLALFLFTPAAGATTPASSRSAEPIALKSFFQKPRLIVVLVVDQFRADYLTRFQTRFLPARGKDGALGGYNYLMSEGAYFPFAEYGTLQCMTGPGHAMILSGAYPYQMGVPLNGWFDEVTRQTTYCVQDKDHPIVGSDSKLGVSPRHFRGNTLGDELKNAGYPSRVVTLALKDRSAIFMGGHRADLALWFDSSAFRWVSSSFYLPEKKLPRWIEELNAGLAARKGQPHRWASDGKNSTGLTLGARAFEHQAQFGDKETLSWPLGIELTEAAALKALDAFKLGQGPATDVFAVSFSSHDYLGHRFGPNSPEMEEMTVAEDRAISRFLNHLRAKLPGGLKDALIVLTADHGVPPSDSWLASARHPAGKIDGKALRARMEARLTEKFGDPAGGSWIAFHADLNWSLAPEAAASSKAGRAALEAEIKAVALSEPGIAFAFTRSEHAERKLPPGLLERQILNTYVPGRSGDVVAIPRAFYSLFHEKDPFDHMSGYTYDRMVPLVISGSRIRKGVYAARADVIDIAPTLSFLTGVLAPASSEGRVLSEILGDPVAPAR
ncbi:MAG: alkaline phosphatase family protein [Oligoflexia bacterium]|nr:alkaline phosphatase family protein [Oligoflexia bacterium]